MPTSRQLRSTRRSPTSTCARSTRRPTPARKHRRNHERNRLGLAGAVFAFAIALAACSGGDSTPTPTAALATIPTTTAGAVEPSTGSEIAPERDLVDLARRYRGLDDLPRNRALPEPAIGEVQTFNVISFADDSEGTATRETIDAELRAISPHAYLFVQTGFAVSDADVDAGLAVFDNEVWPAVTDVFGPPPTPGVDGEERIALVHADLGSGVGGYVSGEDAYPSVVAPGSNGREAIYINVTRIGPGDGGWGQLVAHELQHVIHGGLDSDEAAWINEGLSEYAARLAGGGLGFFGSFLGDPDLQLNDWGSIGSSAAHYGASALFVTYLVEQTGDDAGALAAEPANGVAGVRAFLDTTGSDRDFETLVADWAVANLLDRPTGPYGYREIDVGGPELSGVSDAATSTVHQFATDYIEIDAGDVPSNATLVFDGDTTVEQLAAAAGADGAYWWSGRGDNMDATLTREVDLSGLTSATLTYRLRYDIEEFYDHAYIAVSTDGGERWTALGGRETGSDDPLDVTYGPSYSGTSDGWLDESVDLTPYAGAPVLVRFEYITDDSSHDDGLAIDDIAVPEAGFLDDAERDAGGWHREGFRRVSEPLAQRFALRFVTYGPEAPEVVDVALDDDNRAEVDLAGLGIGYDRAVLVVVAVTDGTTVPAEYRYEIASD